jgi:hypothetical protein
VLQDPTHFSPADEARYRWVPLSMIANLPHLELSFQNADGKVLPCPALPLITAMAGWLADWLAGWLPLPSPEQLAQSLALTSSGCERRTHAAVVQLARSPPAPAPPSPRACRSPQPASPLTCPAPLLRRCTPRCS